MIVNAPVDLYLEDEVVFRTGNPRIEYSGDRNATEFRIFGKGAHKAESSIKRIETIYGKIKCLMKK